MLDPFLARLVVTCLVIWLTDILLTATAIREPAHRIIYILVVFVMVLYLLGVLPYHLFPSK